jgi:putative transposase
VKKDDECWINMNDFPTRRHPAHPSPVERHNQPTVVLLTVCTKNRQPVLATTRVRDALLSAWIKADAWRVGLFVAMPDHVHLFCTPVVRPALSIKRWLRYWKSLVSKELQWGEQVWQLDGWDVQMRTQAQYLEKREYVRQNPERKGLVVRWVDWPFQGEVSTIEW